MSTIKLLPQYQQSECTFIKLIVELYSSFFEFKCERYWQNYSSKYTTYLSASNFFFCSTPTWSISATQTLVKMQLIWCCMLHVWKHSTMRGSRALKRKYHQIQGNFCRFRPNFLKDRKNCYVPSFFECLGPCQADSWPKNAPYFNGFTYKTAWKPSQAPFFPHSVFSSLFKGKATKVLWEKSTSRPRKELRYVYLSRP